MRRGSNGACNPLLAKHAKQLRDPGQRSNPGLPNDLAVQLLLAQRQTFDVGRVTGPLEDFGDDILAVAPLSLEKTLKYLSSSPQAERPEARRQTGT